jgi:hypothetical protein
MIIYLFIYLFKLDFIEMINKILGVGKRRLTDSLRPLILKTVWWRVVVNPMSRIWDCVCVWV